MTIIQNCEPFFWETDSIQIYSNLINKISELVKLMSYLFYANLLPLVQNWFIVLKLTIIPLQFFLKELNNFQVITIPVFFCLFLQFLDFCEKMSVRGLIKYIHLHIFANKLIIFCNWNLLVGTFTRGWQMTPICPFL